MFSNIKLLNIKTNIDVYIIGYLACKEDLSRDHQYQILPTDLDKLKKRKTYGVFLKGKRFGQKVSDNKINTELQLNNYDFLTIYNQLSNCNWYIM